LTPPPAPQKIVLDANVLINLLTINCFEILPQLSPYQFTIPNHVWDEVHRKAQRLRLKKALNEGWLEEVEIVDLSEIDLYSKYRSRFDAGESACLALGASRRWIVASDEKAVKREVRLNLGTELMADTRTLLQMAVSKAILTETKFKDLCDRFGL
jgi:predicted nucleic acid-binding protein